MIETSFISQQNISFKTLLTYSTLIRNWISSCDLFVALLLQLHHQKNSSVKSRRRRWLELEMAAGNSAKPSSRFAAACRSRPCGSPSKEVFPCPEIAFSLVRKQFSEGQPSGSTAWRFVRVVSLSLKHFTQRWPSWGFFSCLEGHCSLGWKASAFLSYILSMLVAMFLHSR